MVLFGRLSQLIVAVLVLQSIAIFEAYAQIDEIIVTSSKRSEPVPGVFLEMKGNFLLLEIEMENDARDLETRIREIDETTTRMLAAAEKDKTISLNLIDDTDLVRPLSLETFRSGIQKGERPDTSVAYLRVKTEIPDKVADSYKLSRKLADFVKSIEVVGRTEIDTEGEITVSVLNPYQYRDEVLSLVLNEIKTTTEKLGPNYRVIVNGLDRELRWTRSGDLNLAFYIPYSFTVVPTSIQTYVIPEY